MVRSAVRSCVPQQPGEATRRKELAAELIQDLVLAVFLEKSGRQLTPFVIGQRNQFEQDNFQIVTVTLRLANEKFVTCIEVNQNGSLGIHVTDNVVEMQITVRPGCVVIAAVNLVNSPQFARRKDECFADVPVVTLKQRSQTGPVYFRNDDSVPGRGLHATTFGIEQSGTMQLPVLPFFGAYKHTDSAVCKGQELVREPNDDLSAGSASLDKNWSAIAHALLNLIYSNSIHKPGRGSLN
jgi:hypothetical protein